MVEKHLVARGIHDPRVLAAFREIPRHLFVEEGLQAKAYGDHSLPIGEKQTISQPWVVAVMVELARIAPESRVLEIGAGSGYQTAILACLARHVYSIEWHLKLLNQAAARFEELELRNVALRCADGSLGWPERAPFDAIIVTAGAPDVPQPLTDQLGVAGRLVVPTGPIGDQTLVLVQRTEAGLKTEEVLKCRFVKLLGAAGWRE